MTVDLLGTIRLLYRVFGFLAQQPVERLVDIADGRRQLLLSDATSGPGPADPSAVSLDDPVRRPEGGPHQSSEVVDRGARKTAETDSNAAEVVARLRSFDNIEEGVAYLASLRPGKKPLKADLLRWCAAADLEVGLKTSNPELERRLLAHTITAKRKYAGLTRW